MVNVIVEDIASRGDTLRERRSYVKSITTRTILEVDKKRLRSNEAITFSEKDGVGIAHPDDDTLILSLKINTHRVRQTLMDTGHLSRFYVFRSLYRNEIHSTPFGKDKYSIDKVHGCCDGVRKAHAHRSGVWTPSYTTPSW
jgi:hypothetical protein